MTGRFIDANAYANVHLVFMTFCFHQVTSLATLIVYRFTFHYVCRWILKMYLYMTQ